MKCTFSLPPLFVSTTRRHYPVPAYAAAQEAPTLARLTQLARESRERLDAIQSLLPAPLRPAIRPGPIEGTTWCLLVEGNAAAAKLRQLLPVLLDKLNSSGWQVTAIRLKLGSPGK
jgi:hypothetical protein